MPLRLGVVSLRPLLGVPNWGYGGTFAALHRSRIVLALLRQLGKIDSSSQRSRRPYRSKSAMTWGEYPTVGRRDVAKLVYDSGARRAFGIDF